MKIVFNQLYIYQNSQIARSNIMRVLTSELFISLVLLMTIPNMVYSQTSMQESVTSHGITWQFSEAAEIGQFVNGDYYVVGSGTVSSITPAPGNGRNERCHL